MFYRHLSKLSTLLLVVAMTLAPFQFENENNTFVSTAKVSANGPANQWSNTDWILYDTLTVDAANINTSVADFPVYVDLSDLSAQFWSTTNDGADIRVTNSSNVELPRELVTINAGAQTGELYFKADSISSASDTQFRIWYNGTTTDDYLETAQYGTQNVWNNDYGIVYHFDDIFDSTINNRDRVANLGAPTATTTVLGQDLSFDGNDAWSMENIPYWEQAWTTRAHRAVFTTGNNINDRQTLFSEGGSVNGISLYVRSNDLYARWWSESSGWSGNHVNVPIAANTTYDAVMVYDDGDYFLYLDGVLAASGTTTNGAISAHSGNGGVAYTGGNGKDFHDAGNSGGNYFVGTLHELRTLDTDVGADWYAAGFANLDTNTFYTVTTPGLTLSTTTSIVAENGGTETFTVVLDAEPTSDVALDVVSNDTGEAIVSPTQLTFTDANWDTPQVVTVTGVDDSVVAADATMVTVSVNDGLSANEYDVVSDVTHAVTLTNDDVPTIIVDPAGIAASGIFVAEAAGTSSFSVALGTQPLNDVVIDFTSNDTSEATGAPAQLTFTNANWDTAQFLTVTAVPDDVDRDDTTSVTVSVNDALSDDTYDSIADEIAVVTIIDDDAAGVSVSTSSIAVTESGSTAAYAVVLDSEPTEDVTITVATTTGEVFVSPATLSFTTANWDTSQSVTVLAVDDLVVDGSTSDTLVTSISSSDLSYDGMVVSAIPVTVLDNEVAGVSLSSLTSTVNENAGTSTFTVQLTAAPQSDVVLTIASNDGLEATVAPATLTFTNANYGTPQIVTVTGVDDSEPGDDSTTISVSVNGPASDTAYGGVPLLAHTVTLAGDDDVAPTITLNGAATITHEAVTTYTDAGATAFDAVDGDITGSIVTDNVVNVGVLGTYAVTYNVTDAAGNVAQTATRTVQVVDTTNPIISLVGGNVSLLVNDAYTESGATASDSLEGDVTGSITTSGVVDTSTAGVYTVTYDVVDGSGNAASTTRTVTVATGGSPTITVVGQNSVTHEVNTSYIDAGATASDSEDGDLTADIVTNNLVDDTTLGAYTVTYDVTDSNSNVAFTATRTVQVVDTTSPNLTLVGSGVDTVLRNNTYVDPGATATDNYDGTITGSVITTGSVDTSTLGSYVLTYVVYDTSGNGATTTRTVNVVTGSSPTVTLSGANPVSVVAGSPYADAGATATDSEDGDLTGSISTVSTVDTTTVSSYTVTHSVYDSNGNGATTTRTVNVIAGGSPTITLNGDNPLIVGVNTSFADPGATANDPEDGDVTGDIATTGSVDVNTVDTYTLTYEVTDSSGNTTNVVRTVQVVYTTPDTVAPSVTLIGANPALLFEGDVYVDEGAVAIDDRDGDVTSDINVAGLPIDTSTPGTYLVTYTVADGAGNTTIEQRTVIVTPSTAPTVDSAVDDSDNDGLTDEEEELLGTSSTTPETVSDGDGVNDAYESEDSDQVPNIIEVRAPNGGDANDDGQIDALQNNVASFPNIIEQDTYSVVETVETTTSNPCSLSRVANLSEGLLDVLDPEADYPFGLFDFSTNCGNDIDVTIYLDQVYDTSDWTYKKYSDATDTYTDISSYVTYATAAVGSDTVTTINYTVTDNGPLDEDPAIGIIRDPAGPSVNSSVSTSNGTRRVCADPNANNYDVNGRHAESLCEYNQDASSAADQKLLLTQLFSLLQKKLGLLQSKPETEVAQCPYFTEYLSYGDQDGEVSSLIQASGQSEVVNEVAQLQTFLKESGHYKWRVTGYYGWLTERAVRAWQKEYANEVLTPWGISEPTGRVYQSSVHVLNEQVSCLGTTTLDNGEVLN